MLIKFIQKWWWSLVAILLAALFIYGYREMFFHQDDLDWFIMANRPFLDVMEYPIGDHVNYVFRLLLKLEWNIFGLYFPGYYAVSLVMHAVVIYLIYLLARETSGRRDLAIICALIFTINTNWTETVLWISGQTISITVIFVLLAMYAILKNKGEILSMLIACLTSALALGLPIATILVYGFQKSSTYLGKLKLKTGWGTIMSLIVVAMTYYLFGTDGTAIAFGLKWIVQVGMVWILAMMNTVIGRLIIPFDRFELIRIVGVILLSVATAWIHRSKLLPIWRDAWSRFLILQIWIYYLIVAAGRAQYGVGIMRAERYSYLGLALFLLLAARVLRTYQLGRWVWIVPLIIMLQSMGLYIRARAYVVRPQQMRLLFEEVRQANPKDINPNDYLPHFVLNDERLRYSDLLKLIND